MRRLHWSALGLAALSVGLLATATPAVAQTSDPIVSKVTFREKAFYANLTDCPADAASRPGLQCALWVVIASKNREVENGTLTNKYSFLDITKFRIHVVPGGFEAVFAAYGWETPPFQLSLRFGPDVSTATLSGKAFMTYQTPTGGEFYKTLPISVKLQATSPLWVIPWRDHYWLGQCKLITFDSYSWRQVQGTGKIGGVNLVTTDTLVFPALTGVEGNFVYNDVLGDISKGVCDSTPTFIPA